MTGMEITDPSFKIYGEHFKIPCQSGTIGKVKFYKSITDSSAEVSLEL